jgi:glucose/arabinose dehydrogenase
LVSSLPVTTTATLSLPTGFVDETIVQGLNEPVGMAFLPDGRLFVIEQRSAAVRLIVGGHLSPVNPIFTVPSVNSSGNEQGLLGIAVDPAFPARPYIYVYFNHAGTSTIYLSMFTVTGDVSDPTSGNLSVSLASQFNLVTDIPDAATNHNGGTLRFGPDSMLYVSSGDDATPCSAQDSTDLRGCILRLKVSGMPLSGSGPPAKSLLVAPGNPYPGPTDNARLNYCIGLRNPYRFSIDHATGDLLIADVGENQYEEVDWAQSGHMNFGWPFREGPTVHTVGGCVEPGGPGASTYDSPITYYNRTGFTAAIIAGGLYRGVQGSGWTFPTTYDGDFFYSDYYQGWLRRIKRSGSTWALASPEAGQPDPTNWATGLSSPSDFLVGPDGALYYVSQFSAFQPNSGSVHRIVHPNRVAPSTGAAGATVIVLALIGAGLIMLQSKSGRLEPEAASQDTDN